MSYYKYREDFDCDDVPENIMPSDIKRIVSHGKHTFHKRCDKKIIKL